MKKNQGDKIEEFRKKNFIKKRNLEENTPRKYEMT